MARRPLIGRIAHCAVHELHHQIRYRNVPWVPKVGEHVISEGLAEAFVRELSGPTAMGPWSTMVSGDALERAYQRILADFEVTGFDKTAAYVLGDTTALRFGSQPVGIPDMAGYAVGLRIVDAHLARSGRTVAARPASPAPRSWPTPPRPDRSYLDDTSARSWTIVD